MQSGNNSNTPQDEQPQGQFRPLRRKVACEVPTLGLVCMQSATTGDLREAAKAIDSLPKAEQDQLFTNELLSRMVIEPPLAPASIADLQDDSLGALVECAVILLGIQKEFTGLSDTATQRARFSQALHEHYYQMVQPALTSIAQALDPIRATQFQSIDQLLKGARLFPAIDQKAIFAAVNPVSEALKATKSIDLVGQQLLSTIQNAQLTAMALSLPMQQILDQTKGYIGLAAEISRIHAQALALPKLTADMIRIGLPEPLLSESLLVSGLNTRESHTPSYQMPVVVPMERAEDVERRAEEAILRRLGDAYDTLAVLERRLRRYVASRMEQQIGPRWWRQRVPKSLRDDCAARKEQREKPGSLQHEPIHYMFLGELHAVISKGDNWRDAFGPDFNNEQGTMATVFLWLEPVRKDVAHPREFSDAEYQQFRVAAQWLLNAIDRALGEEAR